MTRETSSLVCKDNFLRLYLQIYGGERRSAPRAGKLPVNQDDISAEATTATLAFYLIYGFAASEQRRAVTVLYLNRYVVSVAAEETWTLSLTSFQLKSLRNSRLDDEMCQW